MTLDAEILGTGIWSIVPGAGAGTFADVNDPKTNVTALGAGINKFVWTLTSSCGNTTDTVIVNTAASNLNLTATSTTDTTCVGQDRTITATVTGGSGDFTYTWYSVDGSYNSVTNVTSITVVPSIITQYVVYAGDNQQAGCISNRDTVEIYVLASQNLFIPNLLTPNKDGKNDYLEIKDLDGSPMLEGSILEVYNRYGQAVFKSNDYQNDFDPSKLSNGMYMLYLKAGCGDKEYKGWIHIVGEE